MNKEQMLLLKVAEECGELAQMCSKSIRFGLYNNKPGEDTSNITRLQEEFVDLLSCAYYFGLREPTSLEFKSRKAKIDKYLQVSRELGILKD